MDCDNDVILLKVTQPAQVPDAANLAAQSIACHTGRHSCFFTVYEDGEWKITEPVLKDPKSIYK